jgi:hypothetical protein
VLDHNLPVCRTLRLWSPAASSRQRPQELAGGAIFISETWAQKSSSLANPLPSIYTANAGRSALSGGRDARIPNPAAELRSKIVSTVIWR